MHTGGVCIYVCGFIATIKWQLNIFSRRIQGIFGERVSEHTTVPARHILAILYSLFTTCTLEPRRLERGTGHAEH
jgi:hypothetical protein